MAQTMKHSHYNSEKKKNKWNYIIIITEQSTKGISHSFDQGSIQASILHALS